MNINYWENFETLLVSENSQSILDKFIKNPNSHFIFKLSTEQQGQLCKDILNNPKFQNFSQASNNTILILILESFETNPNLILSHLDSLKNSSNFDDCLNLLTYVKAIFNLSQTNSQFKPYILTIDTIDKILKHDLEQPHHSIKNNPTTIKNLVFSTVSKILDFALTNKKHKTDNRLNEIFGKMESLFESIINHVDSPSSYSIHCHPFLDIDKTNLKNLITNYPNLAYSYFYKKSINQTLHDSDFTNLYSETINDFTEDEFLKIIKKIKNSIIVYNILHYRKIDNIDSYIKLLEEIKDESLFYNTATTLLLISSAKNNPIDKNKLLNLCKNHNLPNLFIQITNMEDFLALNPQENSILLKKIFALQKPQFLEKIPHTFIQDTDDFMNLIHMFSKNLY